MRVQEDTLAVNDGSGTMTANHSRSPSQERGKLSRSMEFGKFYNSSYLDINSNVVKKSPTSPNNKPPASFHIPENFSYSKAPPKYGKTKKPGMLNLLIGGGGSPVRSLRTPEKKIVKVGDRPKSPERPAETEQVIKLSHYPSASEKQDVLSPIERDDWPAPPATAVVTKDLVKASLAQKHRQPSPDSDGDEPQVDPKIQRELEEISKIQDSPMAKVVLDDLAVQIDQHKKKKLDPRSASRTASASIEPIQPIRFASSINASPSRSTADRPRIVSDSELRRANKKTPVVHASSAHKYRVKPGYSYGYVSKSLSSVPPGTPGAYVYDGFHGYESSDDEGDSEMGKLERRLNVVDLVSGGSDDGDSVFEKSPSTSSSAFDGSPFLNAATFDYRKRSESVLSVWEELLFEPEETVPYEQVRSGSTQRKKGLDESQLEKYLSNEEFEAYLGTNRESFYRQPEFKRNDLKRKARLF